MKILDFLWNKLPYKISTIIACVYSLIWVFAFIFVPDLFWSVCETLRLRWINSMLYAIVLGMFIPVSIIFAIIYIIALIKERKKPKIKNNWFLDNFLIKICIIILYLFFIYMYLWYFTVFLIGPFIYFLFE